MTLLIFALTRALDSEYFGYLGAEEAVAMALETCSSRKAWAMRQEDQNIGSQVKILIKGRTMRLPTPFCA